MYFTTAINMHKRGWHVSGEWGWHISGKWHVSGGDTSVESISLGADFGPYLVDTQQGKGLGLEMPSSVAERKAPFLKEMVRVVTGGHAWV